MSSLEETIEKKKKEVTNIYFIVQSVLLNFCIIPAFCPHIVTCGLTSRFTYEIGSYILSRNCSEYVVDSAVETIREELSQIPIAQVINR